MPLHVNLSWSSCSSRTAPGSQMPKQNVESQKTLSARNCLTGARYTYLPRH